MGAQGFEQELAEMLQAKQEELEKAEQINEELVEEAKRDEMEAKKVDEEARENAHEDEVEEQIVEEGAQFEEKVGAMRPKDKDLFQQVENEDEESESKDKDADNTAKEGASNDEKAEEIGEETEKLIKDANTRISNRMN